MPQSHTSLMSGRPSGRPTFAIRTRTMPLPKLTLEVGDEY